MIGGAAARARRDWQHWTPVEGRGEGPAFSNCSFLLVRNWQAVLIEQFAQERALGKVEFVPECVFSWEVDQGILFSIHCALQCT